MRLLFVSTLLISVSGAVIGQTAFEVASIKPNVSGDHRIGFQIAPGGRFTATNVTAKMLMQQAYGIKDFQISGAPTPMTVSTTMSAGAVRRLARQRVRGTQCVQVLDMVEVNDLPAVGPEPGLDVL